MTSRSAIRRERLIAALAQAPDVDSALLLDVALSADADSARASWNSWRARGNDVDSITGHAQRLLPSVHGGLSRAGIEDRDLGRIRGLHRRALYRYSLLSHRILPALDRLLARGIPVLVFKGVSLVEQYFEDRGSRPMGDVDLLVPEDRALEAARLVAEDGAYRAISSTPPEIALAHTHAVNFADPEGFGIDVHQHVLLAACWSGADRPIWDRARTFRWKGRDLLAPCAEDAFFISLVQDTLHDRSPSPHWVLDAMLIARGTPRAFDWDRVVELARHYRQAPAAEGALRVLRDRFGLAVPARATEALAAVPLSRVEATLHALRGKPRHGWHAPLRIWCTYWTRRGRALGPLGAVRGFPRYLAAAVGTDSVPGLIAAGARRLTSGR